MKICKNISTKIIFFSDRVKKFFSDDLKKEYNY